MKKQKTSLSLNRNIQAKTENQQKFIDAYKKYQTIFIEGPPGTGKSHLPIALGLLDVDDGKYESLLIVRSAVPVRNIGFLPGNDAEKTDVYQDPYYVLVNKLYGRDDAYGILKKRHQIKFVTTSHLRGVQFDESVIFIDEGQNFSDEELHTVISRTGNNSKLIISGDAGQDDLSSERYKEYSGFEKTKEIFRNIPSTYYMKYTVNDIVRSDFVKDYIIARMEYEKSMCCSSLG